jgi:hypothetical protein
MDEQPIRTLTFANYKAEVYSTNFPGEFRIIYVDGLGKTLEETPLTGISTYRQRETEIIARLRQLHEGTHSSDICQVENAEEYSQPASPSFPASLSATV